MCQVVELHSFERSGFGKAPFRCVGMSKETYQACHGAPIQPGTSCDYCGQGIMYAFHIKSADGKAFKIGGDCALTQLSKASNTADKKLVNTVKREINKRKREMAKESAGKRIEAAKASLEGARAQFERKPHPSERAAKYNRTLADYLDWMFAHAGQTGRLKACKIIESEIS